MGTGALSYAGVVRSSWPPLLSCLLACGARPPPPRAEPSGSLVVREVEPAPSSAATKPLAVAAQALCFHGASDDCNPPGTTVRPESAWIDPAPPPGFLQCAGFVNTPSDDVREGFMDGCLGAASLRVVVRGSNGEVEEDISLVGIPPFDSWPSFNYLAGDLAVAQRTHWGDTAFFTTTDGRDACLKVAAPSGGPTFGSGNASRAVIAPGSTSSDEYRINCEGPALLDRKIAVFRDSARDLRRALPQHPAR